MDDLIKIYNIWEKDMEDFDMQKVFIKAITPAKVRELIERIKELEDKVTEVTLIAVDTLIEYKQLEAQSHSVTDAARLVVNGCRNDYEAVMDSVNDLSNLIGE